MSITMPQMLQASKLIGKKVVNLEGDHLGKIEDVVMDLGNDRIAYAILSFGGFLGIGHKHFAIPWETLRIDRENEQFVLDVPKERLEEAEGFDKDDLPDFNDTRWSVETYEFYGVRPYWTAV